ncbi:MAG: dTDP-4-amino-4,6-dideoxygalactose transaminase [Draconibacterium sp.]|nr:dTDP-4-amino-4,6-dideoxygalactose transaminase [Draconibacterium sp.]
MQISFNRPFNKGNAIKYIQETLSLQQLGGNGKFTKKSQLYFNQYFSSKTLLTTSGTSALEMAALLSNINPGDEVIIPSFTFVSTANAFLLRGAKIVFADVNADYPNLSVSGIEELITDRTKVIVPVHYAGVACNMDEISKLANKHNLIIIEDAAHSLLSSYKGKPLGCFGRFSALSFHETKNINSGEGGLLVVNTKEDYQRAEIIWEKGTTRNAFLRGEIKKYEWVDIGSSFLPSEINAALLYSQIEIIDTIQKRRIEIWHKYFNELKILQEKGKVLLPQIPEYATVNGHLFFLECESGKVRDNLISYLNKKGIQAVFHYLPLHSSPFFSKKYHGKELKNTIKFSEQIIRLPLYFGLKKDEQDYIIKTIKNFF